jgi:hypothetical protein
MVVKILFGVTEDVTLLAGEDLLGLVAPRSGVVVHLNAQNKTLLRLQICKASKVSRYRTVPTLPTVPTGNVIVKQFQIYLYFSHFSQFKSNFIHFNNSLSVTAQISAFQRCWKVETNRD